METQICCRCDKEKDLQSFKVKINGKRASGCIKCNDMAKRCVDKNMSPQLEKNSAQCAEAQCAASTVN